MNATTTTSTSTIDHLTPCQEAIAAATTAALDARTKLDGLLVALTGPDDLNRAELRDLVFEVMRPMCNALDDLSAAEIAARIAAGH